MRIPRAGSAVATVGEKLYESNMTLDRVEKARYARFLRGTGAVVSSELRPDRETAIEALAALLEKESSEKNESPVARTTREVSERVSKEAISPWAGIAEVLECFETDADRTDDDRKTHLYSALDTLLERTRTETLQGGTVVYPSSRTNRNNSDSTPGTDTTESADSSTVESIERQVPGSRVTDAIEDLFRTHVSPGLITDSHVLADSGSRCTMSVTFQRTSGGREEKYVVRRARSDTDPTTDPNLRKEYMILDSLQETAVPVETTCWFVEDEDAVSGPVLVTEWIEADTSAATQTRAVLKDDWNSERGLCRQFVRTLGDIHNIETESLSFETTSAVSSLPKKLDSWQAIYENARFDRYPTIEEGFRWLRANRPNVPERRLIHGDYVSRNLLFDGKGIAGVLDWEAACLSDPLYDLGFVTCPIFAKNSFDLRSTDEPALGVIDQSWLFDEYETYTGREVDEQRVRYWQVFVLVTMLCTVLCNYRRFVADSSVGARQLLSLFDTVPERQLLLRRLPNWVP